MVVVDNSEELALMAQEIGAEVMRGTVRYLLSACQPADCHTDCRG
jgi:hypothetical protein